MEAPNSYSEELSYRPRTEKFPDYKFIQLTPQSGTGNIAAPVVGGQQTKWEINPEVFNLAESVLSFTATPPALGGNYHRIPMDCMPFISEIRLNAKTMSGDLVRLIECANYTKTVWKPETKYEDFIALENHGHNYGAGGMFQKCNVDNKIEFKGQAERKAAFTDAMAGADADVKLAALQGALNTYIAQPAVNARRHNDLLIANNTGAPSLVNVAYAEPKYFEGGAINNASPAIKVKIKLGQFKNTLLAYDKDLYFGDTLYLTVVWNISPKMYYSSSDPLSTGGGALVTAAGVVTISDPYLYLAVEQDIQNRISIMSLAEKGMTIVAPWVESYKNFVAASTNQSVTLRVDRSLGRRLQKIYHSVFTTPEVQNNMYDNSNIPGVATQKVIEFITYLDNKRTQEWNVRPADYDDYMILKDKLKGSVLTNSNIYQYNWFWVHDFTGNEPLHSYDYNKVCGLDLGKDIHFKFHALQTTNAAYNHYTFVITQKLLTIKTSSPSIIDFS